MELTAEVWRDVAGYNNRYRVSNKGRVYSIKKAKILKQNLGKRGYFTVSLYQNGKRKETTVHRMVATAFIDNPQNLPFINHKDECKTNNNVENLEWCTCEYNNKYGTALERATKSRYKAVKQYTRDGNLVRKWDSLKEASETLNINIGNICQCCKGNPRQPAAGGYVWVYDDKNYAK